MASNYPASAALTEPVEDVNRICNACCALKTRPFFPKKEWKKKFRKCIECTNKRIPFSRPGKRRKKADEASHKITVMLYKPGDKFQCDLNKKTLEIVRLQNGADERLQVGFRLLGYKSFDHVLQHIETGPYPLEITFDGSSIHNHKGSIKSSESVQEQTQARSQQSDIQKRGDNNEDAVLTAEEEVRLKARLKARKEARLKAGKEAAKEEVDRLKVKEEARRTGEKQAQLRAEEDVRLKGEDDTHTMAQEKAGLKAGEEDRHKVEEEARVNAEQTAAASPPKLNDEEAHKAKDCIKRSFPAKNDSQKKSGGFWSLNSSSTIIRNRHW